MSAFDFHMIADLLSCPYLTTAFRDKLLQAVYLRLEATVPGKVRRATVIKEFEENPWFVRWGRVDLLKALERAELNSVY